MFGPDIEGEILIARPVGEVFDFVADERNEPLYNPQLTAAKKITAGPLDVSNPRVEDSGLPMHAAALVILDRIPLAGPAGQRALAAGYLAGAALVAWIAVQLLILQRYFFLQPVVASLGIAEIALARCWQRAGAPAPHGRS